MYSYTKEEYERVKLEITKKDDLFKFQMVPVKDDEKCIKKYFAKGVKKNVIKKDFSNSFFSSILVWSGLFKSRLALTQVIYFLYRNTFHCLWLCIVLR